MPICVWKPTFGYSSGGGGMGPWYTCQKSDLIGVDLDSLGLRLGHDWNGQSDRWYWRPGSFPLATLPLDKVRLPPQRLRARELLTLLLGLLQTVWPVPPIAMITRRTGYRGER
jgi:hypothetical protein